ncbi:CPBP family intramembrane glutamic endopeptidase [uncultured Maricaulis sp.]|uniref:CPBP family intramembrane glutamic endopeptidase n=1 Tax=uncultured Maricaulis sp. TaxID=174710 RepID=UPI002617A4D5|nr:CPBP family intramembrane glutamic endopeptidase [uncultured Maricaulis sp.]
MRALSVFLVIAFGFSWAVAYSIHATGGMGAQGPLGSLGLLSLMMMGPAVGALVCMVFFDKGRRLAAIGLAGFRFGLIVRWTVIGWLLPILICALAIGATLALSGQAPGDPAAVIAAQLAASGEDLPMDPSLLLVIQLAIGLPVGILFNTAFLLISEELGWRGWLQPRLAGLGFWPMCLVVGVLWGIWHAPIILMGYNYPELGWTGVAIMAAFTTLWTPYHAHLRERGGVIAAAGLHGSLNAVAGVSLLFLSVPQWPWNGPLGVGGLLILAAGLPVLAWLRRGQKKRAA